MGADSTTAVALTVRLAGTDLHQHAGTAAACWVGF
jgi:hypothetical protein